MVAKAAVIVGVANGTSKNVGLGKFQPDLEISKAFFKGLEVSFSRVFLRLGVSNFFTDRSRSLEFFYRQVSESRIFLPTGLGVSNFFTDRSRSLEFFYRQVSESRIFFLFLFLFGFQKSNFSEFRGTSYGNERVN